jgi:hypothetical protein
MAICNSDPFHHRAFSELLVGLGYNGGVPITREFGVAHMDGRSNEQIGRFLFPDWDQDAFFRDKEALFARYAREGLEQIAGLCRRTAGSSAPPSPTPSSWSASSACPTSSSSSSPARTATAPSRSRTPTSELSPCSVPRLTTPSSLRIPPSGCRPVCQWLPSPMSAGRASSLLSARPSSSETTKTPNSGRH